MESSKLKYELTRLFKSYAAGSMGVLYYPHELDGSPYKKAFIRVKRLEKKGLAQRLDDCLGHPVYSITPYGIQVFNSGLA